MLGVPGGELTVGSGEEEKSSVEEALLRRIGVEVERVLGS